MVRENWEGRKCVQSDKRELCLWGKRKTRQHANGIERKKKMKTEKYDETVGDLEKEREWNLEGEDKEEREDSGGPRPRTLGLTNC